MRGNSFCRQKWRRTNRGSNTFALTAVKWAPRFGDGVGNCNFTKISSNFCAFRRVFLWYFLDIFWIFFGYFLDIFLILSWYYLDISWFFGDGVHKISERYVQNCLLYFHEWPTWCFLYKNWPCQKSWSFRLVGVYKQEMPAALFFDSTQ